MSTVTPEQVRHWLSCKEHGVVEFKEARQALPGSLFETVCAFLNRDGGVILFGVDDRGRVTGVDPTAVDRLTADIVNLSNNPQKLDPPHLLAPDRVDYEGNFVLVLQVPSSPQVHRCAGVVYDRGHDGDFRVPEPVRIAAIVNRKHGYHTEQVVHPHLKLTDFEPAAFAKARSEIRAFSPKHPWLRLTNKDLLVKAGLWRADTVTRTKGYTLAAALLFGKEEVIQQLVPAYKIDALVRRQNLDRYDDRLNLRVNLIDAFDLLMEFVAKHLPDPFHLDGTQRISLREKIFREIVANLLVHREYTDARPATLIIYRDRVETTNAAIPHGHGPIRLGHFTPFPKNPTLSKFFMQMGRGEELGSGILNVTKYLPYYTKGGKPQFIEGDPFVTIIPLPTEVSGETTQKHGGKAGEKSKEKSREKSREKILGLIAWNPTLTVREMVKTLAMSRAGIEKVLRRLKDEGHLRRIGPDKGGHWEVRPVPVARKKRL